MSKKRAGRIVPFRDQEGKPRFRVVASNGRILAFSESYETRRSMIVGARSLVRAANNTDFGSGEWSGWGVKGVLPQWDSDIEEE